MLVYREEIDGLRCIAVISVILYHAGFTMYFSGGYVGVDIFFVISGYLITSIIQNECQEDKFSLIHFYERRCRRILPALFLILFLSSIFAYYYMLPRQLLEFGETLICIICFSSNIYFWWKDDDYFVRLNELNPLIHTWSLAIEEQFYLVFPLLCYLFIKKKTYLIILLAFFAIISLFLGQWSGNLRLISTGQFQMFSQDFYASFYLPTGRIWELLFGSFIAFYLQVQDSNKKFSRITKQLLSLLGLLLIIISIVFFDNHNIPPFPNFYTLIPICGATLIILFGDKNTLIGYLLSTRLLQWIGLISYSAYLWHQPLFVFTRLKLNQIPSMLSIIIVISIVFPLSVLSYLFIEKPFRNKEHFSRKQIFCISGLAFVVTFILALFLIQTANNRSLMMNSGNDSYLLDLQPNVHEYVHKQFNIMRAKGERFSNRTEILNRRILIIGDSFAEDFYNMIIEGKYLMNYEIRGYYIDYRCQIYIGLEDRMKLIQTRDKQHCINANHIKYALPIIRQADIIILASIWSEWSVLKLPMTIKLLNLTKQQQIFVIGTKSFGRINPALYFNTSTEFRIKQYQYPLPLYVYLNNFLEKNIDKSIYVNIVKMICTGINQTCPLFTPQGRLISFDGLHLTRPGAIYIGNIIFKNKPLNKL